ncbi:MAG: glycosyltransferase N-terminal domain-containing protein, partial [Verrucomicrobiaceae bacterium]
MARFLILLFYNLLYPPAMLLMVPGALRKLRARGGKISSLWQRLGFFDASTKQRLEALRERGPVWWMHAVSVGEVGVAGKLIAELTARRGGPGIVLSTTTPTGFAQAQELAAKSNGNVLPIYNPLDGWFVVRRCLRLIAPQRLVLVEAEVWPNLVFAARRRGIEVTLVNARLSPRSERRYGRVLPLVRPIFSMLSRVFVQEPDDFVRWERLGVPHEDIICAGSIKYDTAGHTEPVEQVARLEALVRGMGWGGDDPVLLAASTHAGEEVAIARVFTHLRSSIHNLHLIIVPRHVERSPQLETELQDMGIVVVRRSVMETAQSSNSPGCLLVDTTGELRAWQHVATVVVVGKSFLSKGGQNPAEAIMAGKPVIFGPHMENFAPLVRQLLAARGSLQVRDFDELEIRLLELFHDKGSACQYAANGLHALRIHEGATARTADSLLGNDYHQ